MSERERIVITQARHEKLARQIEESPLNNPVREVLLLKLKVASSAGYAAVLREYEEEMELYRAAHLPSYRPKLTRKPPVPQPRPAPTPAALRPATACPPAATRLSKIPTRRRPLQRWKFLLRLCRRAFNAQQFDFLSVLQIK